MTAMAVKPVKGTVKGDGKPLAGVTVSDGYSCAVTDAKGRYTLTPHADASFIWVSTPSGWLPPVDSLNRPVFYKPYAPETGQYDFLLAANPRDDRHHAFIAEADIQAVDEGDLSQYDATVADARDYMASLGGVDLFGLDCGDIVGDHPELYPASLERRSRLGFPVYYVPGNHDMRYWGRSHETSMDRYEQNIMPSRYSFNRGGVHYVGLDNCFYIGRDYFYMGYIDENTFRWLEQDLARVPKGSPVVLFMHIPLAHESVNASFTYDGKRVSEETVNGLHLARMLAPYPTHVITGHQHWNRNVLHSDSLYEHNTAAACGLWWQTPVCEDGTPRGYGVYRVNDGQFDWIYKSTGYPADYQMRVYAPGECPDAPEAVVANVWNYDPTWRVELLENGVVTAQMEQFTTRDPLTVSLIADRSKLRYSWTSASPNPHMFKAVPRDPTATLAVRATDRQGRVYLSTPGR